MNKNNIFVRFYRNTHLWIVLTCIGVWILVFQNFGTGGAKDVYVVGGEVEAEVNNTVDVNLHKINGYRNFFTTVIANILMIIIVFLYQISS